MSNPSKLCNALEMQTEMITGILHREIPIISYNRLLPIAFKIAKWVKLGYPTTAEELKHIKHMERH